MRRARVLLERSREKTTLGDHAHLGRRHGRCRGRADVLGEHRLVADQIPRPREPHDVFLARPPRNGHLDCPPADQVHVLQNIPLGKDDRLAHKVLSAGAFFQQLALGRRQVFQHRSIRKSAFGTPADAFQGRKIALRHGFRGIISMTKIMFFLFLRKSFPLSSQKTPRDRGVERSCRGGGAQPASRRGIICAGSFPGPRP